MTGDRARSRRPAALWAQGQFAGLCLAQAGAAALVLTASLGTGRTGHLSTQTSWVAVGVAGIAVAAVSAAVWVLSGNRRLVRRRIRLSAAVGHTFRPRIVPGIETEEPVAGPTMSHYHRRDCQLVRGKDARPATAAAHQRAQRTPCAVCRP
jgi:hypothetical protein